jgi:hypothetical protein
VPDGPFLRTSPFLATAPYVPEDHELSELVADANAWYTRPVPTAPLLCIAWASAPGIFCLHRTTSFYQVLDNSVIVSVIALSLSDNVSGQQQYYLTPQNDLDFHSVRSIAVGTIIAYIGGRMAFKPLRATI